MANTIVNKTDRKKLISTEVIGNVVVWHRTDTGEEINRLDILTLTDVSKLIIYGAKQVCSDVVANESDADKKCAGISKAVDALRAGGWPKRESTANVDNAVALIMSRMGITRAKACEMLGIED